MFVRAIYSFLVHLAWFLLKLIAHFNPKIKLFVKGRKDVFVTLKKSFDKTDRVIWMHVASLGEYEQGLPILEQLSQNYPKHKILLTFFSPSGFEVKKNAKTADVITYLPLDTIANASKFINLVKPEMVLFIKYETDLF
jgi:3-deoxy-D-manno-octulosonic-acid transferase